MRTDGRTNEEFRKINIIPNFIDNIPGGVLIEQGKTRLICTAGFETKVPQFLKESDKGWIGAEYSMLPASTGGRRVHRERERKNNRNVEIQRFVGRALRTTVNLKDLKGLTLFIDTDVVQADGSTRCAAVNGGMVALMHAFRHLVYETVIPDFPKTEMIAAVSIGIKDGEILVDLSYEEDSNIDADINIVSSEAGNIIQVQAFAEESSIPRDLFHKVVDLGVEKNLEIIEILKKYKEV